MLLQCFFPHKITNLSSLEPQFHSGKWYLKGLNSWLWRQWPVNLLLVKTKKEQRNSVDWSTTAKISPSISVSISWSETMKAETCQTFQININKKKKQLSALQERILQKSYSPLCIHVWPQWKFLVFPYNVMLPTIHNFVTHLDLMFIRHK